MISLVIPATSGNEKYTEHIKQNIREYYPNEDEVEIVVRVDDKVNLGTNYNEAVKSAKGEKIILLHNDMVIKPGFVEEMDSLIEPNTIVTYTRVEPPIYTDIYPGKVLLDCGKDLETFDKGKFLEFKIEQTDTVLEGGSQLFFGCMKDDYIGLDATTYELFCEDDDLHLRFKLAGFKHIVSTAHVYHFVSKTSRAIKDYQAIEYSSNINFIRKWGFRSSQYNKKYNVGFVIKNCTQELLTAIEPWCSTVACDIDPSTMIAAVQPTTRFNLSKKIKSIDAQLENDIIISFDASKLVADSLSFVTILADSLAHNEVGIGEFEYDIYKVDVKALDTYEDRLIKVDNPYLLNQLL